MNFHKLSLDCPEQAAEALKRDAIKLISGRLKATLDEVTEFKLPDSVLPLGRSFLDAAAASLAELVKTADENKFSLSVLALTKAGQSLHMRKPNSFNIYLCVGEVLIHESIVTCRDELDMSRLEMSILGRLLSRRCSIFIAKDLHRCFCRV
jgi:hypothetical protein